jgi:glycerol-3-phosphate dehydrogenase subunit B
MLGGTARVGFPAVLGLKRAADVLADLQEALGCPVFEIPTAPPSVPGVRLYDALRRAVLALGGEIVLGPRVLGWLERGQLQGVRADGPGGERRIRAGVVVLATGGLLGGGLEAGLDGMLRETVFGLPVDAPPLDEWFDPLFFGHHPVFESGVRANTWMQALDASGEVVSTRLYAVGGLLGGADRLGEHSAEGIALATAAKAVEVLAA